MAEQPTTSDYDICNCDCHEYLHKRRCRCCQVCPCCQKRIVYNFYRTHITETCPLKQIPVHRLLG
jgi:hypothetical protein